MAEWRDFEALDIRIGTITEAYRNTKAKKAAFVLKIDFGDECGVKLSSAQLTHLYHENDLLNRQILAVVNFPPKRVAGVLSECLVLGLYGDNQEVILIQPDRKVRNGLKLG